MRSTRSLIPAAFAATCLLAGAVFAAGPLEMMPDGPSMGCQEAAASASEKPDTTLTLKIGDPKLKERTMEVAAGSILSGATGRTVGFDRMIAEMRGGRFVHVGETHDSMPMHDLQFRVLEALHAQDRHLAVGMEMLPVTVQETLNKWSAGILTKEEFIREVRWYVNWNFNFGYYEKIFDFAKEHRLPVYALNIPREIISKIRMRGWEALSDEEKALVPEPPDVSNQDHRTLIRAIFESSDLPPQMKGPGLDQVFEGLYRSQSAWDEVMAANAVRGARSEGRRVVVCAGSGHLIYNLGLNRRAFERSGLPFKTVVAVTVPPEKSSVTVSRSYADYILGIAEEAGPAFPSIGLSFKNVERLTNLVIDPKPMAGEAAKAGFEKGDVVLSVDGAFYDDINELRTYLARFRPGDTTTFKVLRDGQVKDVVLEFEKGGPKER